LKEASSLDDLADLTRNELHVNMIAFPIGKRAESLDEQLWIYQGALMLDLDGLPKEIPKMPLEPIGKALLERRKQRPRLKKLLLSLTSNDSLGHLPQIRDLSKTLNAYAGLPCRLSAHNFR
jgi:hypothetical protein